MLGDNYGSPLVCLLAADDCSANYFAFSMSILINQDMIATMRYCSPLSSPTSDKSWIIMAALVSWTCVVEQHDVT